MGGGRVDVEECEVHYERVEYLKKQMGMKEGKGEKEVEVSKS